MEQKKNYWTYQKSTWLLKDLRSLAVTMFLSGVVPCDENFKKMLESIIEVSSQVLTLQKKGFFPMEELQNHEKED